MRALRDIKIGEEITVNYRQFWMMPREDRQTELKETYNFNCHCEACDITEQEIEKEANNCKLYWEEEKMKTNIKAIQGTYESVVKEAECLKRMYKLARVTKGISKKNFLWKIVEELFDVSCQGYLSAECQRGIRETEKARWMKDIKLFAALGLKLATTIFGVDGVPLREAEAEAQKWKSRERDPLKYFRQEYGGAVKLSYI